MDKTEKNDKIMRVESENIYKTLLETLPQRFFFKDKNLVYSACNKSYASDFSKNPDEITGKTDYDLYSKDLAEKHIAVDRQVLKSGKTIEFEEEYVKDGQTFWVNKIKAPIKDDNGKITGILGIFWDITDLKRAEKEIRKVNSYTRSLIEASVDPLLTIGPDGKITDVNAATETVTGYSRQKLIGADFSDYFTEPEKARAGYQQVFREGQVRDYALEIRHKDGKVTPVLYNASVYRDEVGKVVGVFAAARDITEQKKLRDALDKQGEEQQVILDSVPAWVFYKDKENKFIRVNKAFADVMEMSKEQLEGKSCFDLYPKEQAEAFLKDDLDVIASGKPKRNIIESMLSPKGTIWVQTDKIPFYNAQGNVIGIIGFTVDITEQKQAKDKLQEINEKLTKEIAEGKRREEIIAQQTNEILELSTPVMQVWEGIVIAPLIGTIDSERTQRFMDRLLTRVVETNSPVALVDITGVPTLDTQTAQHLIEAIAATRLLGANVVVTGVRPAIAQTLVHLGIDLSDIMTKSSLSAGLRVALDYLDLQIIKK